MLKELHIENLAVIENATIALGPGLNVFTGETGAGKSILIGGINAVLGRRVSRDIVRTGAEKAYISAVFDGVTPQISDKLREIGVEPDDELIISREISADGKGTARVNSRAVSVSAIRELGDLLINIHGQHDSQILLDQTTHLSILDGFAELDDVIEDYRGSFRELQLAAKEVSKLKQAERERAQRSAYLQSLVSDIGALNLTPGEDAAVEERFRIMDNAVGLSQSVRTALMYLSGDDDTPGSGTLVENANTELSGNEELLQGLKPLCERLSSVGIELSDISDELSKILDSLDIDDREYEQLSQRRDELTRVKRRYGTDIDGVIKMYEDAAAELEMMDGAEAELEALIKKRGALLAEVSKKAERLSALRAEAAERFRTQVEAELSFLNMPDVKIEVKFSKGNLTQSGMDQAEFLISANRGEEPRPLSKIASGGELSRIMLALKSVLAERDGIPTLIFDEIDSGVSGRAAQKIGVKLKEISRRRQVICVTHLSQIAIMGDTHILIEKHSSGERTATDIRTLDFEGRKLEIARIIGGDNITETVLKDAEEQLRSEIGKEN